MGWKSRVKKAVIHTSERKVECKIKYSHVRINLVGYTSPRKTFAYRHVSLCFLNLHWCSVLSLWTSCGGVALTRVCLMLIDSPQKQYDVSDVLKDAGKVTIPPWLWLLQIVFTNSLHTSNKRCVLVPKDHWLLIPRAIRTPLMVGTCGRAQIAWNPRLRRDCWIVLGTFLYCLNRCIIYLFYMVLFYAY